MSGRGGAILTRIGQAVPVVIGVVIISFVLTRALPGDPAVQFAGLTATPESIEQTRVKLGLDRPLPEQFLIYVGQLLQGDLGQSVSTGRPVTSELAARLPASLELTLVALFFSCAIAIPLGVLAATRPGSWIDQLCRLIVTAGVSLPTFFTGIVLIYVFYYLPRLVAADLARLDAARLVETLQPRDRRAVADPKTSSGRAPRHALLLDRSNNPFAKVHRIRSHRCWPPAQHRC